MIAKSFIFLEGIGPQKERELWSKGVYDWNEFLKRDSIEGISNQRKEEGNRRIKEARNELYNLNSSYFSRILPSQETWRIYDFFREEAVFLDIETTGCAAWDRVTVVGMYDGKDTKTMVRGINLEPKALKEELSKYKVIVTFNGASFDLPFIEKRFPGVLPKIPHIDLRPLTRRLGHTGGLKAIEGEFGIKRRELVGGIRGGDAITLWKMYRGSGDRHYLDLLIEYNEEDIINLQKIADSSVKRMEAALLEKSKEK